MAPPDPDGARKGPETTTPSVDEPTWSLMHYLAETSSLSREGKAAVAHLFERLEARLGRSWPGRLYAKRGHLFPELERAAKLTRFRRMSWLRLWYGTAWGG